MHIGGNDAVCSDDDIHAAIGQSLDHAALFGSAPVSA